MKQNSHLESLHIERPQQKRDAILKSTSSEMSVVSLESPGAACTSGPGLTGLSGERVTGLIGVLEAYNLLGAVGVCNIENVECNRLTQ